MYSRTTSFIRSALGTVLLLAPMAAHAQQNFNTGIMQTFGLGVQIAIETMNLLTWIAFIFLNQLLDPLVIFNNGAMSPMLNEIWQLSRDIMNVAFALVLIGAAVYTVITAKKDFVASNLKKFVMAVVLVNFSWFIPMVILDVANVAATTVFNLPSALGVNNVCTFVTATPPMGTAGASCTENSEPTPLPPGYIPQFTCDCVMAVNAAFFVDKNQMGQYPAADGWSCYLGQTMCVHLQPLNSNNIAPHSYILNGLILNHARLAGIASLPPAINGPSTQALIMYFLQMGVLLFIHIALFFPLAAMTMAFAIRIPVLWFTIAFMPFWILTLLPLGSIAGEYPKKLGDYFIKAAFLPALCGVPLTIGFIMINAGQQAATFQSMQQIGFRLTNNISDFFELLWLVMCLGIFYMGVFAVLKDYGGIMAKGAGAIEKAGKSMGSIAMKAPLHALPMPIPGGGSILSFAKKWNPASINQQLNAGIASNTPLFQVFSPKNQQNQQQLQNSAQTNKFNGAHMTALDTHIQALTAAVTQQDKDRAMQNISTHMGGVTINAGNVKQQLQAYTQQLNLAGASTGAGSVEFGRLQTSVTAMP